MQSSMLPGWETKKKHPTARLTGDEQRLKDYPLQFLRLENIHPTDFGKFGKSSTQKYVALKGDMCDRVDQLPLFPHDLLVIGTNI